MAPEYFLWCIIFLFFILCSLILEISKSNNLRGNKVDYADDVKQIITMDRQNLGFGALNTEAYYVAVGGKHVRGAILLALYDRFSNLRSQKYIKDEVLCIEYLHSGSLIIDDLPVFDGADTRRGDVTLHKKYTQQTAVSCSMILFLRAIQLQPVILDAMKILLSGQFTELTLESISTKGKMHDIVNCKTVTLFALIGDFIQQKCILTKYELENMNSFLYSYGMAYQIADDVDDATTDEGLNYSKVHTDAKVQLDQYLTNASRCLANINCYGPFFQKCIDTLRR
jgi:geranylgeranyl pyrophosphate synthase